MKRLLYLATLSLVASLLFAPAALAQVSPAAGNTGPYGCPEEAPFVATAPGDPGEGSLLCFATQSEADAYGSTGEVPAAQQPASQAPISCAGFTTISGEPSQWQAQQYYDFLATPEEQAILDPDGNGFACDHGTAPTATTDQYTPAADQYTPAADQYAAPTTDSALPATGGPALLLSAGVLLLGAGLLGLRMTRHS